MSYSYGSTYKLGAFKTRAPGAKAKLPKPDVMNVSIPSRKISKDIAVRLATNQLAKITSIR